MTFKGKLQEKNKWLGPERNIDKIEEYNLPAPLTVKNVKGLSEFAVWYFSK